LVLAEEFISSAEFIRWQEEEVGGGEEVKAGREKGENESSTKVWGSLRKYWIGRYWKRHGKVISSVLKIDTEQCRR
jgi:hypothetical protein